MKTGGINTARHTRGHFLRKLLYAAVVGILMQAAFYFEANAESDGRLPVLLEKIPIGGGRFLYTIEVDISNGTLELAHITRKDYPKRADFQQFIGDENPPAAAINGCFFDLNSGKLVGHIYRDGHREIEGSFSAAFAVNSENKASVDTIRNLGDVKNYRVIIGCVDILMKNGDILIKTKADLVRNGHDPSRHNDIYKPARWSALGISASGKVYLVATPSRMYIYDFIKEVKSHTSIRDMLGMDGGSSSGLYYGGQILVRPSRPISSVIMVRPATVHPQMIASVK